MARGFSGCVAEGICVIRVPSKIHRQISEKIRSVEPKLIGISGVRHLPVAVCSIVGKHPVGVNVGKIVGPNREREQLVERIHHRDIEHVFAAEGLFPVRQVSGFFPGRYRTKIRRTKIHGQLTNLITNRYQYFLVRLAGFDQGAAHGINQQNRGGGASL